MLTDICIRNFAIIETLDLDFNHGMHVLTGETGAGKSIIIDAMELALGKRVTMDVIHANADRAEINVTFNLQNIPNAKQFLKEQELDNGDECVLRRIIGRDGRNKSYINSSPVTLQILSELSELLINIHGQHEFQTLLQPAKQRRLLDDFTKHQDLLNNIEMLYEKWHALQQQYETLKNANQDATQRIEFLTYQVNELNELNLSAEDIDTIDHEHKQLAHADQLLQNSQDAMAALSQDGNNSVLSLLAKAQSAVQAIVRIDPKLETISELLNNASIYTEEALGELTGFLNHLDLNPEKLNWLEQQLTKIHDLARKHRVKPAELPALHQTMQAELDQLENRDENLERLQQQIQQTEEEYHKIAKKLSANRKQAAKKLSALITENMQQLGMPGGRFDIQFETTDQPTRHGLDKITFMVSANPGHPFLPLNKVASGGELSRISLAIQVITAKFSDTPTLIFDEVDVGIGGATADIVGQLLKKLGETTQVLCVTHLAQVAAKAHHHFLVSKATKDQQTTVTITPLDREKRVAEIARMSGGVKITKQTLAHAEEMLS